MKHVLCGSCLVALLGCGPAVEAEPVADTSSSGEPGSTSSVDTSSETGAQGSSGTTSAGPSTTTATTGQETGVETGLDESSGSSSTGATTLCTSPLLDPDDRLHLADSPMRGNPDGLITIVQWTGYEDPFSGNVQDTMEALLTGPLAPEFRVVAKQMPLRFQDPGGRLALAGLAAHALGQYWAFHDAMFAYEGDLDEEAVDIIAEGVGLDLAAFHDAMGSPQTQAALDDDMALFTEVGGTGTPSSVVNGAFVSGAQPLDTFEELAAEELEAIEALIDEGVSPCIAFEMRLEDNLP